MKNILFLVLSGIFFIGCKKVSVDEGSVNLSSIAGTWELRQAQNGMTPIINYSSGNGNILQFTDSTYKRYKDGNLTITGYYIIIRDNSVTTETGLAISPGQFISRIIFDGDVTSHKTFFEISNSNLTFLSGFFPVDGGSSIVYQLK